MILNIIKQSFILNEYFYLVMNFFSMFSVIGGTGSVDDDADIMNIVSDDDFTVDFSNINVSDLITFTESN